MKVIQTPVDGLGGLFFLFAFIARRMNRWDKYEAEHSGLLRQPNRDERVITKTIGIFGTILFVILIFISSTTFNELSPDGIVKRFAGIPTTTVDFEMVDYVSGYATYESNSQIINISLVYLDGSQEIIFRNGAYWSKNPFTEEQVSFILKQLQAKGASINYNKSNSVLSKYVEGFLS